MDKLKRRTFPFGVYLLTGVMLAACGGGGGGGDSSGESRASSVQGTGDKELSSGGGEAQPGDDPPNVIGGDAEPGDDSSNIIGGGAEPVDDEPDTSGDVAESGDDEPDKSGDVAESGDDEPDPDADDSENSAPSISGTPATSIVQNSAYQFVPLASDPDGDPLTFSIIYEHEPKPGWTSFDPVTGILTGTPTAADVGTTDGIVISVTDGTSTASLPPFGITVDAIGPVSVTLSWTIPTTNEDGTPLTDLAGFKIYYRTITGTYSDPTIVDNPGVSSFVIENLSAESAYFFAAKAFDTSGNDSDFSNEVEAP
ncbi:MAG: fibronectin type III domain-containing protein [Gammaproteobacteria bacterium]|nr:fibronectin type III domain-containing protein [Gammaproteobacteria bacterium]